MNNYRVELKGRAWVTAWTDVVAETEESACELAIGQAYDVEWCYDALDKGTLVETEDCELLAEQVVDPLQEILRTADEEGWSEDTALRVVAEFLSEHADLGTFKTFLEGKRGV